MAAVGGLAAPAMLLAQRRRDTYTDPGEMERAMATLEERFWAKVEKSDGCWLWTGAKTTTGYGSVWLDGRSVKAHRVAYELLVGRIPDGLTIDHLCRVRLCVNPAHLEPVTNRENTLRSPQSEASVNARKTHCPKGHPYEGRNLRVWVNKQRPTMVQRRCVMCDRFRVPAFRAAFRAGLVSVPS